MGVSRLLFYAAVLTVGAASPANAHTIPVNSGAGLLANCTIEDQDEAEVEHHLGLCIGFIKGVGNVWSVEHPDDVCLPRGLDNRQLVETVITLLASMPELQELESAPSVIAAMKLAFPCP